MCVLVFGCVCVPTSVDLQCVAAQTDWRTVRFVWDGETACGLRVGLLNVTESGKDCPGAERVRAAPPRACAC